MTKLMLTVAMLLLASSSAYAHDDKDGPFTIAVSGVDNAPRYADKGGAGSSNYVPTHYGNTQYAGGVSRGSSFAGNPNVDLALGHPPVGTILGPLAGSPKVDDTTKTADVPAN